MAARNKIYSVQWEDGDGEQGYYVKTTKVQAEKIQRFLTAAEVAGTIKNPTIGAIEGEWLLTPSKLLAEFDERYRRA